MIESVKSFKVGDKMFGTFEEAQIEAIYSLIITKSECTDTDNTIRAARAIVANQSEVLSILRATPNSMRREKPARKPRSDKGVPRKKTVAEMETSPGVVVQGSGKYAGK